MCDKDRIDKQNSMYNRKRKENKTDDDDAYTATNTTQAALI